MNERLVLLYILEPTAVTPRLRVETGALSEMDLRLMERELEPDYPGLCNGSITHVEIKRRMRDLPQPARFKVSIRGKGERNPDLELEYVPFVYPLKPRAAQEWSKELLATLKRFAGEAAGAKGQAIDRQAIDGAVRELEELAVRAPDQLGAVLLCGYVCYARMLNLTRAGRVQQHYDKMRAAIESAMPPSLEREIDPPEESGGLWNWILGKMHGKNDTGRE